MPPQDRSQRRGARTGRAIDELAQRRDARLRAGQRPLPEPREPMPAGLGIPAVRPAVSGAGPVTPAPTSKSDASSVAVTDCGVDTIALVFRPPADLPMRLLTSRASSVKPAPGGGVMLAQRAPGGARVVVDHANGLVRVEGRAAAILARDEQCHELAPAAVVPAVERELRSWLELMADDRAVGFGTAEVARLDLAGEIAFGKGAHGLEALRRLGACHAPRMKTVRWDGPGGRPETVYWVNDQSRRIQLRAYDKGVEAGTHGPGERVRLERQWRPKKGRRVTPTTLAALDLRELYVGPLRSWVTVDQSRRESAAQLDVLPELVLARVGTVQADDKVLTIARAERIIGTLVVLHRLGREAYGLQQAQRRLRELRTLGLVEADREEESIREQAQTAVPVLGLVAQLRDRFAA